MTALYNIVDNITRRSLGVVSRHNVKAVLCDEYDTSIEGVMEAIEDIEAHMCHCATDPEFGCDVLNCSYSEVTLDEVKDMAISEVRQGAYVTRTERAGHPFKLVGFSDECRRALQAAYCGYDVMTGFHPDRNGFGRACHDHYIESAGMSEEEADVMRCILANQCRC